MLGGDGGRAQIKTGTRSSPRESRPFVGVSKRAERTQFLALFTLLRLEKKWPTHSSVLLLSKQSWAHPLTSKVGKPAKKTSVCLHQGQSQEKLLSRHLVFYTFSFLFCSHLIFHFRFPGKCTLNIKGRSGLVKRMEEETGISERGKSECKC